MKVLPASVCKIEDSLEEKFLSKKSDFVLEKKNSIIISSTSDLQKNLIVKSVLNNETESMDEDNLDKRTCILLITKDTSMLNFLVNLTTTPEDIYSYSKSRGQKLRNHQIFCDMNDKKFAFVYWRDILYKYYEKDIPAEIPLYYILPIAKGRVNFNSISRGNRNKIGRKDDVQPPTFVISDVLSSAYDSSLTFDHIYIDGNSVKKPIETHKIKVPYTLFFNSPFDYRLPYLLKSGKQNLYLLKDINVDNVAIETVKSPFDEDIIKAFQKMDLLIKSRFNTYELKIIGKLLKHIVSTPIDGVEYDFISSFDENFDRIRDLVKELIDSDYRYENDNFEEIIKIIEDIYNKHNLDNINPKYISIEERVNKCLQKNKRILIITDGKINTLGLKEKLALKLHVDINDLKEKGIEVSSYKNALLLDRAEYDEMLLTSLLEIRDLEVLTKSLSSRVSILLYRIEVREMKKNLEELSSYTNKVHELEKTVEEELVYKKMYRKIRNSDNDKNALLMNNIEETLGNLRSLSGDFNQRLKKPYQGANATDSKLIIFEDNTSTFLKIEDQVKYRKTTGRKVETKKVEDLQSEDEIILIDGDIRKDLFNLFLKSVTDSNESKYHNEVIKKWRELYENKYIFSKLDDTRLYKRMKDNGWEKVTKGVLGNWRSGYSYGPRDKKDIEILGETLGIQEFIEQKDYYYRSMSYIRVEMRTTAMLLNKIIYYSEKSIDANDNDFLNKYNLTLEDVKSAINIKKVLSVSKEDYKVKPTEIGVIFNLGRE